MITCWKYLKPIALFLLSYSQEYSKVVYNNQVRTIFYVTEATGEDLYREVGRKFNIHSETFNLKEANNKYDYIVPNNNRPLNRLSTLKLGNL